MTAQAAPLPEAISLDREVPPRGGLNATALRMELRRLKRNRRMLVFTVIMPLVLYYLIGNQDYALERVGKGNFAASFMTSMALYGAMIATVSAGASVATERAQGWSRQLRLTPMRGWAYITTKVAVAMLLGLVPVVLVYIAGMTGKAELPTSAVIDSAILVWLGSSVFAAFGLFVGYLLPSENAMQVVGPVMALLAFGAGLFSPVADHGWVHDVSMCTPMWGVAQLAHGPQSGWGDAWQWGISIAFWLVLFVGGSIWLFRRDTKRG